MANKKFWKNKKVFVTGADGFLGSWLCNELVKNKAGVVALFSPNFSVESQKIKEVKSRIKVVYGDITSFERMNKFMRKSRPEIVFHLAALSADYGSNEIPLRVFEANAKGTWNVIEAARINGAGRFVAVSSIRVYGSSASKAEDSAPKPESAYNLSKVMADEVVKGYARIYGMNAGIARLTNTYGPGDANSHRIIPRIVSNVVQGKAPVLDCSGKIEKDFLYAEDAVNAFLALAENLHRENVKGEVFNFASGKPITLCRLAEKIIALAGKKGMKVGYAEGVKSETSKARIPIAKAGRILKWKPRYSIEKGLKETIGWYAESKVKK